jgi:hypothetical protein
METTREAATQNRVCVRRSGGKTEQCEHYARCRRTEPNGAPLPCERLLDWEKERQPEPAGKQVYTKQQQRVEQRLVASWPEGQESVTVSEAASLLGQTPSSARRHLERLVARGRLVRAGQRGRAHLYAMTK